MISSSNPSGFAAQLVLLAAHAQSGGGGEDPNRALHSSRSLAAVNRQVTRRGRAPHHGALRGREAVRPDQISPDRFPNFVFTI